MDSETFACLTMLEICVSHLRSLEIVTPRSLTCFTSISLGIGSQKVGVDFKKLIVIVCDLVGFTVTFRFLDSSEHWVRISTESLLIFLWHTSRIDKSSTYFHLWGNSLPISLITTRNNSGPNKVPWGIPQYLGRGLEKVFLYFTTCDLSEI